jgi:hypothetical protein
MHATCCTLATRQCIWTHCCSTPTYRQVVSDENRRVRLHGGAVAPIVGSLQWSAEVGAPPDPWASLPSVPTFSEETQVLVDDMATRRSMPSLYTSLPDMARWGPWQSAIPAHLCCGPHWDSCCS